MKSNLEMHRSRFRRSLDVGELARVAPFSGSPFGFFWPRLRRFTVQPPAQEVLFAVASLLSLVFILIAVPCSLLFNLFQLRWFACG
jgi:hypothetical protein